MLGPLIDQQFNPFYYVIAGDIFSLNCTASNPKSHGGKTFSWYRNNEEVTYLTKTITIEIIPNFIFSTSQLYIEKVVTDQHSGRYICVANNQAVSTTTMIIES